MQQSPFSQVMCGDQAKSLLYGSTPFMECLSSISVRSQYRCFGFIKFSVSIRFLFEIVFKFILHSRNINILNKSLWL